MRFVFVRHGHYDKVKGVPAAKNDLCPLTRAGKAAARLAGEYLRAQGVVPDLVVTTKKRRTRQTADELLATLGTPVEHRIEASGFSSDEQMREKVAAWLTEAGDPEATILFVGSKSSQDICLHHGGAIPKTNKGCVLIYRGTPQDGWTLVGQHEGTAPKSVAATTAPVEEPLAEKTGR